MKSPLYVTVLFQPLVAGGVDSRVASQDDDLQTAIGLGRARYIDAKRAFDKANIPGAEPPFNETFINVRRLQNLTPEQAAELEREYAIRISVGPGSQAPSMGG